MIKTKFLPILIILAVMFTLFSCNREKNVEYGELGIVLDKSFEPYDSDGAFNAAYSDGTVIVGFTRFSFVDCIESGMLTTWTPMKFAEIYLENMNITVEEKVRMHGDVPYFTYTLFDDDGNAYYYMPTFYRTQYAYFVITFITPASKKEEGRAKFFEYMSTAYIKEEDLQ